MENGKERFHEVLHGQDLERDKNERYLGDGPVAMIAPMLSASWSAAAPTDRYILEVDVAG